MSDTKISALPSGTALVDTDTLPVVRAGATTKVNTGTLVADVGTAKTDITSLKASRTTDEANIATLQGQIATIVTGPAAGSLDATAGSNVYGPIWKLGRPDLISWTWQNQGTATIVDAGGVSFMTVPSAGTNIRSRLITAPATPYTITGLFKNNGIGANNQYCGLIFRESSTGKDYIYYILIQGTLQAVKFTNDTTFAGVGVVNLSYIPAMAQSWHWLRVTDDGVNLIFSVSGDGVNFETKGTESRTAFMAGGPNQVGIFGDTDSAGAFSWSCASWVQT